MQYPVSLLMDTVSYKLNFPLGAAGIRLSNGLLILQCSKKWSLKLFCLVTDPNSYRHAEAHKVVSADRQLLAQSTAAAAALPHSCQFTNACAQDILSGGLLRTCQVCC